MEACRKNDKREGQAVKSKEAQKFDYQVRKLTATKGNYQGVAVEFKRRE